jgi:DNA topoisomerase-1
MTDCVSDIRLSYKKITSIFHSSEKCAKAINLTYVRDGEPGIKRIAIGKNLHYVMGTKRINDKTTLARIKKLAIPPAWENVWICISENGHLQATGIDTKNRKQYKYHPHWIAFRSQTKFYRLHRFGKTIPVIRQKLKQDLSLPGFPVEKVLATVVMLMEHTSIRVGNEAYEKLYGSFGLTTLKNRHVNIAGDKLEFAFKGKKGIMHNIGIKNKRLAKIVKQCKDIPGKELFQYYDSEGHPKPIDSGMVNDYLKTVSGEDFTAKDFRTWAGTVHAISEFYSLAVCETSADIKNNIVSVLNRVAEHLGNTRTVCKKYYVHPIIISLYENNKLQSYLAQLNTFKKQTKDNELSCEENLLMFILENEGLGK